MTLKIDDEKNMNTKYKGNITEMECMLAFMKCGYNVLTPYGDCERYDFVVDVNGKFYKIQCKTAHSDDDNASFKFECRSSRSNANRTLHHSYSAEEIDYFATIFDGKCYLIPIEICGSCDKRLRLLPTKNGQTRGVTWAKEYELEEVIKSL